MTAIFSILLFISSANFALHDIHISKAELNYKSERKMMQISMHIFLDDLEDELKKMGAGSLYLCTEKENEEGETYMLRYIEKNFKVLKNGAPTTMEFIGKESSEDLLAVWCYFQIPMESDEGLSIINQIMLSRFDDQKNIVSVKSDGKRKAFFILDRDDYTEDLD